MVFLPTLRFAKIRIEGDDSLNVPVLPDSKKRKYYILVRLLNGEHLSYQHLADNYFVSRSSIANDIVFIKQLLAKDNVALVFDNSGTYIGGGEIDKQKVLKRLVMGLVRQDKTNPELLQLFISQTLLSTVKETFDQKIQAWSLEIPENYLWDIIVSASIVIYRGRQGYFIQQAANNQLGKLLFQLEKYPLVYELLESLEKKKVYHFSQDELRYLSYIILGNGFKFFMKDATIPIIFKRKVKLLIRNISDSLNLDLTQDSRLETDLLVHLYQMVLRLRSGTTVINPLLDEIKANYLELFGVIWYALSEFGSENQLVISDDEVAFVTLHFQAAIERLKNVKRILFVCPNGIGTSSLIAAKMRQILPEVSIIEIVARTDLAKKNLRNIDLIISTTPLTGMPVPVTNISPMLTPTDMKKIMNQYIDLTMSHVKTPIITDDNREQTLVLLKHHIYFDNVKDFNQALDLLIRANTWATDSAMQKYRHSIEQREKLQSTYLGNGFAIPHGDPHLVDHSCIAVLILDKPIKWGNNKVDVVSLLMVREEDKKIVESFMNLIMHGINNKDWFISKMMEVK